MRAADLIRELGLVPHREGGAYRETHRSPAVTTIWFLLAAGEWSRWHRVASDEIWHFVEGEPLEILVVAPAVDAADRAVLGPLDAGHSPFHVVPAGWWQAARPLDAYTLVTCTVAPAFDAADFSLMSEDPSARRLLHQRFSSLAWLL